MGPPSVNTPYVARRREMVAQQLRPRGIHDTRVLEAMGRVPRHRFVPASLVGSAYADHPLPIGQGQTISQPYTVAYMCQEAEVGSDDKVLEVGTGSGYGAAVLSQLAREVHTVERIPQLAEEARLRLTELGCDNVTVHVTDGSLGLPGEAPFDAIIVTAGAPALPEAYVVQLAEGGRCVIPLGDGIQTLYQVTRRADQVSMVGRGEFRFVPLLGAAGWRDVCFE